MLRNYRSAVAILVCFSASCFGESTKDIAQDGTDVEGNAPASDTSTADDAVDGWTGASTRNHFDKPEHWTKEDLIEILREGPLAWGKDAFWAMATTDGHGTPNIASLIPWAVRDDVLIIGNRQSTTKTNMYATKRAHAIFRTLKPESGGSSPYDPYGLVGHRLALELVDDPNEIDALWEEYKKGGTPIAPSSWTKDDFFFVRIIEISPIG